MCGMVGGSPPPIVEVPSVEPSGDGLPLTTGRIADL